MEELWLITDMSLSIIYVAKSEKTCALRLRTLPKSRYTVQVHKWNGFAFAFVKLISDPIATKSLKIIKAE